VRVHRRCLLGHDKKGGLEDVFNVVHVAENSAADVQNQGPCRRTNAAKARSSRRVTYWPRRRPWLPTRPPSVRRWSLARSGLEFANRGKPSGKLVLGY
jgi:hypothetical protein